MARFGEIGRDTVAKSTEQLVDRQPGVEPRQIPQKGVDQSERICRCHMKVPAGHPHFVPHVLAIQCILPDELRLPLDLERTRLPLQILFPPARGEGSDGLEIRIGSDPEQTRVSRPGLQADPVPAEQPMPEPHLGRPRILSHRPQWTPLRFNGIAFEDLEVDRFDFHGGVSSPAHNSQLQSMRLLCGR